MAEDPVYSFSVGTIRKLSENILLIEYNSGIPITAEHVMESGNLRKTILGNSPYYPIIDMRKGFVNFTKEAKAWVAENVESAQIRIMDVFLVPNWATKFEATLYLKVFKPRVTTKIVTSLDEALSVINEHQSKR